MNLPISQEICFKETTKLRNSPFYIGLSVFCVVNIIILFALLIASNSPYFTLLLPFALLFTSPFWVAIIIISIGKVTIIINKDYLYLRCYPFQKKFASMSLLDIKDVQIIKVVRLGQLRISWFKELNGRIWLMPKEYYVSQKEGILIIKNDKSKILIGSSKTDDIQYYLKRARCS